MRGRICSAVVGVLLIGPSSAAFADDEKPAITMEERLLEIMKSKEYITEKEYAELKGIADEMREQEVADREGLEREIDRFVQEAMVRSDASGGSGFETGYKKGFYILDPEGRFSMTIGGRLQVRYTYVDRDSDDSATDIPGDLITGISAPHFSAASRPGSADGDTSSIRIRRGRFYVAGNVIDKYLNYKLQIETAGSSATLLDYYLDYTRLDPFNLRIGQYKVPFSRQELTSSERLQLMDRAISTSFFAPARDGGAGIMAHGTTGGEDDDFFEYYAGIFNGEGQNSSGNDGPGLLYAARVAINPMGAYGYDEVDLARSEDLRFSIGANIFHDAEDSATAGGIATADIDNTTFGIDGGVKWMGFTFQGEYYRANLDPDGSSDADFWGWYAQAGYLIPETNFEIAGRVGQVVSDDDFIPGLIMEDDEINEYVLGVNYYFYEHRAKINADWTHTSLDPDDGSSLDDNQFRIQIQLVF